MAEKLFSQFEERGCKCRIVSIQHLRDLREEIEDYHRQGLLDEEFYKERLTWFNFSHSDSLPGARSLIVVAVPQPQIRVTFTWNGKLVPLIVPPTYLHWRETDKQIKDLLAEILGHQGYQVAQVALPVKLLAVGSGLGAYGRNNICYVDGMGSFHRLAGFYSNLPCQEDVWQKSRMMESCKNCSACLRNCPTGAITSERFLLYSERCITFHNERPSKVPLPSWIDPLWHNCLVGCLHCQKVCPQNMDFLQWVEEGADFSQEETALLLQGVALDKLPIATVKKLEQLDMVDLLDILPRNLNVLLNKKGEH